MDITDPNFTTKNTEGFILRRFRRFRLSIRKKRNQEITK
jgi:hypothetical protein